MAGELTANYLAQLRAHYDASDGHGAEPVHVIAHSHGTAILLAAARQHGSRLRLGHVIFAGSDLDYGTDITAVLGASEDFTNFWSPEDGVLFAVVGAGYAGFLNSDESRRTDIRQVHVPGIDHFAAKWEENWFGRVGWMSYRMAYDRYADKVGWVRDPELPGEKEEWMRTYVRLRNAMSLGDPVPLSPEFR